jgi:predicted phosphodiesterase
VAGAEDFMKIVIVSDIHSNFTAVQALPELDFDQLWCIGDLVDYGPRPHEVVEWVKRSSAVTVHGNHDNAAGFCADPRCSSPFKRLAAETLRFTQKSARKTTSRSLELFPITTRSR